MYRYFILNNVKKGRYIKKIFLQHCTYIIWCRYILGSVSDPDPFVRIRIGLFFLSPDPDRRKIGSGNHECTMSNM